MRIGIIGTRGIPNHYGGFEQFAEFLAVGLVEKGFDVVVYNSHSHPYKNSYFKGVEIVHCWDPEDVIGTAGQFIYDLNCIFDSRKRSFDIILQLGYTSSSIWSKLFPKNAVLTTNMDGLEWKRTKYSKVVQRFLKYAEALAIKHSDHLISDSVGIQKYIRTTYGKESIYIPYGSHVFTEMNENALAGMGLNSFHYDMLVARLEPENNIEVILEGVSGCSLKRDFLVVGNHETKFGEYLKRRFESESNIKFVGGIYDQELLNNLRYFSNVYFHGHTVGGTNPSLLEAMGCSALICAHENEFNRAILGNEAYYFTTSKDVSQLLETTRKQDHSDWVSANVTKVKTTYSWSSIVQQYLDHFTSIVK